VTAVSTPQKYSDVKLFSLHLLFNLGVPLSEASDAVKYNIAGEHCLHKSHCYVDAILKLSLVQELWDLRVHSGMLAWLF